MKERTGSRLRGVLLSVGAVPLLESAPVSSEESGVGWQARELDVFLAELDAGGELPDVVVVPCGDPDALRALRGHHRSCCVPMFAGGAAPPGVVGWDGVATEWTPERDQQVARLLERMEQQPSTAARDSDRRAHGFARFVASRQTVSTEVASTFGLLAPRTLLQEWQNAGWVDLTVTGEVHATPLLVDVVRAPVLPSTVPPPVVAEPPPAEETGAEAPVEEDLGELAEDCTEEVSDEVRGDIVAAPEPEPAALPEPPTQPRARRRWLLPLSAWVVFLAVETRAGLDAGLLENTVIASWWGPPPIVEADWEPSQRGPRLDVPAAHPGILHRLAQGDPAFRRPTPVANEGSESNDTAVADAPGEVEVQPVAEPEPVVEVEPERIPEPAVVEAIPPSPPAVPREFQLEAQPRFERTAITLPRGDLSIAEWTTSTDARVAGGAVIARLHDPSLAARAEELQALRDASERRRAGELEALLAADAEQLAQAERASRHATQALEEAEEILAERERVHARNLSLVEEGVLGYGEIRADWEAVLAARTVRSEAARGLESAQDKVRVLEAKPAPSIPEPDAVETLLLTRWEQNLAADMSAAVLRAPHDGIVRGPLAAVGASLVAGGALAYLESALPTEGSAILPESASDLDWWAAEASLQTAPGVGVPVQVSTISRTADGRLRFHFAWPAAAPVGATLQIVETLDAER